MAIFRKIHVTFWSDPFISELDRDKKMFYLYLLTNERTTQCGIYEITKKQISFDLGYSIDTVSKLLLYFIKCKKIMYNETTKEIALKNWAKYNISSSPKVQVCVKQELSRIKDTLLIQYLYTMDTQTQEEQEEEQEEEKKEDTTNFKNLSEHDFKLQILEFKEYDIELLKSFFLYWSEKNHKGKMKFQLQNTWELKKRLATWAGKEWNKTASTDITKMNKTQMQEYLKSKGIDFNIQEHRQQFNKEYTTYLKLINGR